MRPWARVPIKFIATWCGRGLGGAVCHGCLRMGNLPVLASKREMAVLLAGTPCRTGSQQLACTRCIYFILLRRTLMHEIEWHAL
jgi:hypothetical protein